MKALVISDIHANLTALKAVLEDAASFDAVWCLGDLVGYGPDPNECVELIRSLPNLNCVMGNHDAAVLNMIEVDAFNPEARSAIRWTQQLLSDRSLAFLRDLPETLSVIEVTLVHGSPRQPVWEYLLDTRAASFSFDYFSNDYCFVGHTHLPAIYQRLPDRPWANMITVEDHQPITLEPRLIINPGSVGQPRDRDPRSAYLIYDTDSHSLEFRRVAYALAEVQERMRAANLPERHIQRLGAGW